MNHYKYTVLSTGQSRSSYGRVPFEMEGNFSYRFQCIASFHLISNGTPSHLMYTTQEPSNNIEFSKVGIITIDLIVTIALKKTSKCLDFYLYNSMH